LWYRATTEHIGYWKHMARRLRLVIGNGTSPRDACLKFALYNFTPTLTPIVFREAYMSYTLQYKLLSWMLQAFLGADCLVFRIFRRVPEEVELPLGVNGLERQEGIVISAQSMHHHLFFFQKDSPVIFFKTKTDKLWKITTDSQIVERYQDWLEKTTQRLVDRGLKCPRQVLQ
jgi:hypothetical protein